MRRDMILDRWADTDNIANVADSQTLYDKFMNVVRDMKNATKVVEVPSDAIQIISVKDISDTEVQGFLHTRNGQEPWKKTLEELRRVDDADDDIIKETKEESFLMYQLGADKTRFFASPTVINTLGQRAGDTGRGKAAHHPSIKTRFFRDGLMAAYMSEEPCQTQVIYKEVGKTKKIFSVMSDRYKMLPSDELFEETISLFEKEMGKMKFVRYYIDNFFVEAFIEFPEKAADFAKVYNLPNDVVPGIRMSLSDTGDGSMLVEGTIRIGRSLTYIPKAQAFRKHTKKASKDGFIEKVEKCVFVEYTKVPERLIDLLGIPVQNPATTIEDVLDEISGKNRARGDEKDKCYLISKKFDKALRENLAAQVNPSISYTAYDVATMILEAGSDLETPDMSKESLSKIRGILLEAVWYKY